MLLLLSITFLWKNFVTAYHSFQDMDRGHSSVFIFIVFLLLILIISGAAAAAASGGEDAASPLLRRDTPDGVCPSFLEVLLSLHRDG